jgi:hypothetical protein
MIRRKPSQSRGYISFGVLIIIALVIGIFLRNVKIGLIIGLALGLLSSSLLRRRN